MYRSGFNWNRRFIGPRTMRNFMIEIELQVLLYFTLVGAMTHRIKIDWLGNYHLDNSYLLHCKQTNLSFIQSNQSSIHFSKCFSKCFLFFWLTDCVRVWNGWHFYVAIVLDWILKTVNRYWNLLNRILFLYYNSWASCSNCRIMFSSVKSENSSYLWESESVWYSNLRNCLSLSFLGVRNNLLSLRRENTANY